MQSETQQMREWLKKRIKLTERAAQTAKTTNDKIRFGSRLTTLKQCVTYIDQVITPSQR